MKFKVVPSKKRGKKYTAIFECPKCNKTKVIHFGAEGMSDFTKHKDPARKERYLKRHRKREDWNNPMTAGALSRWILWNKETHKASVDDFVERFDLEGECLKALMRKCNKNKI
tara:strand:- start:131 stop:469 length:339 start_codon:yes stop_codon:yes gene_type:complete